MYILLSGGKAAEIIPDVDPVFPGVPVNARYSAEFLANCVQVPDEDEVCLGQTYNGENFTPESAAE